MKCLYFLKRSKTKLIKGLKHGLFLHIGTIERLSHLCSQSVTDRRIGLFLALFLVDQEDGGGQKRAQTTNIPDETDKSSTDGSDLAAINQLRSCLKSLDEMKARFVEERNQWNTERAQLNATSTEACRTLNTSRFDTVFSKLE